MATIKDLFDALRSASPAAFPIALAVGIQSGIGICQLTRIPFIIGFLSIMADKRQRLIGLCSFMAGLVITIVLLGFLLTEIPRFGIVMSLRTSAIYDVLAFFSLVLGLALTGILPFNEQHLAAMYAKRAFLAPVLAFLTGCLYALIETPICPNCGSLISTIAADTIGKGNMATGICALFLYALGECLPFALPALMMVVNRDMLYDKKNLHAQFALLMTGFFILLSALFFLWTS